MVITFGLMLLVNKKGGFFGGYLITPYLCSQ
jgi:hypothetical protein